MFCLPFLVAVLAAGSTAAQLVPWNFTLSATSPLISYEPVADGKQAEDGWALWTSDVGYNPEYGKTASGTVLCITERAASSFSLDFRGTAIHLMGQANATYTVSVDGKDSLGHVSGELLFSSPTLDLGKHTLTLTVTSAQAGQYLHFSQAIITTTGPPSLAKTTYGRNDPHLSYVGSWSDITVLEVGYRETFTANGSVTLTFSGATAVAANANLNWGHWLYEVRIDGQLQPKEYNASSLWLVPSTTLFFADGLDPAKEHTLTLTHLGDRQYYSFSISSFDVYRVAESADQVSTADDTTASGSPQNTNGESNGVPPALQQSSMSIGAAVGIAVGGIAALLLLGLGVSCLVRSRRRVVPSGSARLGPSLDMEKPSPPPSTRSPPYSRNPSPPNSHITPLPLPPTPPPRIHFDTDDTISVPPSMPSTDGGIRPYGFTARRTGKRQNAGVVNEPAAGGSSSRVGVAQSATDVSSPTATERRAVERVIAMIAERMDQPPGFITAAAYESTTPPPSYPSTSRKR